MRPQREDSQLNQSIIETIKTKNPKNVEELVKLLRLKHKTPEKQILEQIINLQNQGRITLKDEAYQPPSSFKDYILSTSAYWYWTIVALALTTALLVFTIPENAYPIVYARYILGSIFVLLLPGYNFIKALFPAKELDNIERISLSIGTSLAIVPITGLLLNYTPWGIRITPITISLLALTLAFATAALLREHQTQLKSIVPLPK